MTSVDECGKALGCGCAARDEVQDVAGGPLPRAAITHCPRLPLVPANFRIGTGCRSLVRGDSSVIRLPVVTRLVSRRTAKYEWR
jgi:hypothetical protein